ncbi:MAG: cellobiose phosphorylase [Candidatus Omnitrophica bacterium]|jgi:cellobiose phosphorylase|nr:cellobiose phosphorylase [Candidatus Omnitrophota bacterium]
MENTLYNFIDNAGSFSSLQADKLKSLYLPLCNEKLMSSISADLHGDIKTGQNSFLMPPASRVDLAQSKYSRNFWVHIDKNNVWSAAGVSRNLKQIRADKFRLQAGMLWQKVERKNTALGLKSEILSFIPSGEQAVELMQVKLTNISRKKIVFTAYAAIPLYCRGANSLRDHRHVTSLLTRVNIKPDGILVKPTLLFDEAGHQPNYANYFVLGWDQAGSGAQYFYPSLEDFCGDSGDLESPQAVLENRLPQQKYIQGKEPMAALRFHRLNLNPGKSVTYIIVIGIHQGQPDLAALRNKFRTPLKVLNVFEETKAYWLKLSRSIGPETNDKNFDNWFRWVNIQPNLRRIFGCSFLPDFDYGKGGRGWRDLWQDCLGLILNDPLAVRADLVNNFCGVKIDGSNATIICKEGSGSSRFIADRNNLSRVWMDHGVWPLLTLNAYINETGDLGILFEKAAYFRNHEINRTRGIDKSWSKDCGSQLKTAAGKVYQGSILEHLLVQNLVQFLNVGSHNHLRLEGADWNDGLDMAALNGESVAFSAMYAYNLEQLSLLILKTGKKNILLAREIDILLSETNYRSITAKQKLLERYFAKTCICISGKYISVNAQVLADNLKAKSLSIKEHIRKDEWLKEGFFNGYYDNRKKRLEGKFGRLTKMTLTSQVFPIFAGIATREQTDKILRSVYKHLSDKTTGGLRLNTDFGKEQHDLGRAFSFAYGEKENGAIFSHMVVMFACALYKQSFAESAWKIMHSLYQMALDTSKSKIYPCLPEYFNRDGRGMYSYLTGSASWFVLTLLNEAFGLKGENGDLVIEPKLSAEQFSDVSKISIQRVFAGRQIRVNFFNPRRLKFGKYKIIRVLLDQQRLPVVSDKAKVVFTRELILALSASQLHTFDIHLG